MCQLDALGACLVLLVTAQVTSHGVVKMKVAYLSTGINQNHNLNSALKLLGSGSGLVQALFQ